MVNIDRCSLQVLQLARELILRQTSFSVSEIALEPLSLRGERSEGGEAGRGEGRRLLSLPAFFPHPNPLPEGEGTGSRLRLSGKTYLTEY